MLIGLAGCSGSAASAPSSAGPKLQSFTATYSGSTDPGVTVNDLNNVSITGTYDNGEKRTLTDCKLISPVTFKVGTKSTFNIECGDITDYFAVDSSEPLAISKLTVTYDGSKDPGTQIDNSNPGIKVYAEYNNGSKYQIGNGWNIKNPGPLKNLEDTTYQIEYDGFESTFTIPADIPVEYQNALNKAESYSSMMHMSKKGIFDQLTSKYGEQFDKDAAQYAVDHLNADYKANALEKAKDYRKAMSMSKKAIFNQLISRYGEQFTKEEAQYAIDNLNK